MKLMRISKAVSYVLLILFITMILTGFVLTGKIKGIPRSSAALLHQQWLSIFTVLFFSLHSVFGIRLYLIRKQIYHKTIDILLSIGATVFFLGCLYLIIA